MQFPASALRCAAVNALLIAGSLTLTAQTPPTTPAEPPAAAPRAQISGGGVTATILLPDDKNSYYKGGRFDWGGIIYSLKYAGHDFYGPWFTDRRDGISDFIFEGDKMVAGPASSSMGPTEEYGVIGYEDAKPGETFIKIGIGLQRRPEGEARYNHYTPYELVDRGKVDVKKTGNSITFTQTLNGPNGYAYVYTKTLSLASDKPQLTISHSLKNTGTREIASNVYNHNFLTIDRMGATPGYTVTAPYELKPAAGRGGGRGGDGAPGRAGAPPAAPQPPVLKSEGKTVTYLKKMEGQDRGSASLDGFSANASDSDYRLESAQAGVGVHMHADQPLLRSALWSVRSVVAVEPYIDLKVAPGQEFKWAWTYDYYTTKK
jgi:hypothetical protein